MLNFMIVNINLGVLIMAIAKLPGTSSTHIPENKKPETIKENTIINDVPDTTTDWTETISQSHGVNRYVPVDGLPCFGTYYQCERLSGDVSDSIDVEIAPTYQAYAKINNMKLLLDSDRQDTFDTQSKLLGSEISVIIVDTVIPNRGDCFVSTLDDGQLALYVMTTTNRLTAYNGTAYTGTMVLKDIVTLKNREQMDNLELKVVKEYYYNPHYMELGQKPTLTTEELQTYHDRSVLAMQLEKAYQREFIDSRCGTYVLQTGDNIIYDGGLTNFIISTFKNNPSYIENYINQEMSWDSIYTMLTSRFGSNSRNTIEQKIRYIPKVTHMDLSSLYGHMYLPITHYAACDNLTIHMFNGYNQTTDGVPLKDLVDDADLVVPTPLNISPDFNPFPSVVDNETYLLSPEWYSGESVKTTLETMINDWLVRRSLEPAKLKYVHDRLNLLNKVDRFYLLPIIIFLINYSK